MESRVEKKSSDLFPANYALVQCFAYCLDTPIQHSYLLDKHKPKSTSNTTKQIVFYGKEIFYGLHF